MSLEESRHPFLNGLSKHRGAPPTVVVIFGASGDLTARKLVPAIFNLGVDNLLPGDFHLIGYGRKPMEDAAFQATMDAAIEEHSRRALNKEIWGRVRQNMHYHAGAYDAPEAFVALAKRLMQLNRNWVVKCSDSFIFLPRLASLSRSLKIWVLADWHSVICTPSMLLR